MGIVEHSNTLGIPLQAKSSVLDLVQRTRFSIIK